MAYFKAAARYHAPIAIISRVSSYTIHACMPRIHLLLAHINFRLLRRNHGHITFLWAKPPVEMKVLYTGSQLQPQQPCRIKLYAMCSTSKIDPTHIYHVIVRIHYTSK